MERARAVLAEATNLTLREVPDDAEIGGLEGWDSLAHMRLIVAIEKMIARPLATEELITINSLPTIDKVLKGADPG